MPFAAACSARFHAGLLVLLASGCIGHRVVYPVLPTPDELREFEAAGPQEHVGELPLRAMRVAGPYRVVAGDLIAVVLPAEVQGDVTASGSPTVEIRCRVQPEGDVRLPWLGDFPVAGQTTGEIEEALADAYNRPERLKQRPNVVVTVTEHATVNVAVIGAVNQPGLHALPSDQRSVLGAVAAAGGIENSRGAARVRVLGHDETGNPVERDLSVQLDDILLDDLALAGGETVVVEPLAERQFSVIGLVKRTGIFPYPQPRRINLMQALATAGGVDENAAPRYATVYRVNAEGQVIGATFKIDGTSLTDASNVWIKDGDVIAVEHTQGSWLRQFFSQILGFRANYTVTAGTSPTL